MLPFSLHVKTFVLRFAFRQPTKPKTFGPTCFANYQTVEIIYWNLIKIRVRLQMKEESEASKLVTPNSTNSMSNEFKILTLKQDICSWEIQKGKYILPLIMSSE